MILVKTFLQRITNHRINEFEAGRGEKGEVPQVV
jgi:hypothetical protein